MSVDIILTNLQPQVDKPMATCIVTEEPDEQLFIGEVMLTVAALFVLRRYLVGVCKELGVEELGATHIRGARELLNRIRGKKITQESIQNEKKDIQDLFDELNQKVDGLSSKLESIGTSVEDTVAGELDEEFGITSGQSRKALEAIRNAVET